MSVDPNVTFKHPPVAEVVLGIQFRPLPGLLAGHLGRYWEGIHDVYPTTRDVPPLLPVIEAPPGSQPIVDLSAEPSPRVFFLSADQHRIVQVQNGRYHANWQKVGDVGEYPRYPEIRRTFLERWSGFLEFVDANGLGPLSPTQYEITYVNHIPEGTLWGENDGISKVFPWLNPKTNFVVGAPAVENALHYPLPQCQGRLHATTRVGIRVTDRKKVLSFELTARGAPAESQDLATWFDNGREAIVRSFVDLTGPEAHAVWAKIP